MFSTRCFYFQKPCKLTVWPFRRSLACRRCGRFAACFIPRTLGLSIYCWCRPTSSSVCLVSFPFHCALQDGFGQTWWTGDMTIPQQFASLYHGQEVFVWSDCLLDLGTDFLVGNMVFVWDMLYLPIAPHFHGLYSSLVLCCEGPWFTSIQEDECDKGAHQSYFGT